MIQGCTAGNLQIKATEELLQVFELFAPANIRKSQQAAVHISAGSPLPHCMHLTSYHAQVYT